MDAGIQNRIEVEERKIEVYYQIIDGVFKRNEALIIADKDNCRYPFTNNALYFYSKRLDELKGAMKRATESNSYYTSQVLIRVVIEHFLIGYYLYTKCRLSNLDKTAREYYREFFDSEYIARIFNKIMISKNVEENIAKVGALAEFNAQHNSRFTQEDINKIDKIAKQFKKEKEIVKYLLHGIPQDDYYRNFNQSLLAMLDAYNYANTYVHGGITAEHETFNVVNQETKTRRMKLFFGLTRTAIWITKLNLMSNLKTDHVEYYGILRPFEHLTKIY